MDLALARHPQTILGHAAGLAEGAGDLWGWWGERHSLLVLVLQSRLVLLLQDGLLCNAAMQLLLRLMTAAKRCRWQQALLKSSRNACCRHELPALCRAICIQVVMTARTRTQFPEAKNALFRFHS